MEEFQQRRKPARCRKVSEIKIGDEYVRVVGLVVEKKETEFVLDDGSGRLTIFFDDPKISRWVETGYKVRVFGVPSNVPGANELHAEIVQNVGGLDLDLYGEVRRELKKFEMELGGGR